MNDFSDFERAQHIDRYLAGRLNPEETRQLETALQQHPEWQQAYEAIKLSRHATQEYALRDEIRSIRAAMRHEGAPEATAASRPDRPAMVAQPRREPHSRESAAVRDTKPVRPLAYAGRIAAGVALLLLGFLGFQYLTLSADDLYAERATAYQITNSRSADESADSLEEQMEQRYRARHFAEAIATYEQLSDPSLTATFLAGNAYLQQNMTDQAIAAFRQVADVAGGQRINRFAEDAQYYLAMSYLKADRPDEALPLLEEIHNNPRHSYHDLVGGYYLWKLKFLNRIR